jgi:hypothetical protein
VTKKCFKIIATNNQSDPISDFYLDVAAFVDSSKYPAQAARAVALHTIEYLSKTHSAVRSFKFPESSLASLLDAFNSV